MKRKKMVTLVNKDMPDFNNELLKVLSTLDNKRFRLFYTFGIITYFKGLLSVKINDNKGVDRISIQNGECELEILLITIVSIQYLDNVYFFTLRDKSDFSLSLLD